ncbi:MAG: DUF1080 domain-containing protein [Candidatus Hydrogenedentes bacterium]|nr:DUF1080 domain-containing protein [Candidatus Hydrogenedentota bacterium]
MKGKIFMKVLNLLFVLSILFILPIYSVDQQIIAWLERAESQSIEEINTICEEVLKSGESAILKICEGIKPYGDDRNVKVLIRALVNFVSAKSKEEQTSLSDTLCKALKHSSSPEVKAFLISELQLLGNPNSVSAIAEYISDEYLCEYAVRALATIGTPEAFSYLIESLQTAKGKCSQNIISALTQSGRVDVVSELKKLYSTSTGETKVLLLFAIAKLEKDPNSFYQFVKGEMETDDVNLRTQVIGAILSKVKDALKEKGASPEYKEILDDMLAFAKTKRLSEVECSVLNLYSEYPASEVFDLYVRELDSPSGDIRAVALQYLTKSYNADVKKILKEHLYKGTSEVKIQILNILPKTRDAGWFDDVASLLNTPEESLRSEAIQTMVKLDATLASKTLSKYLLKCETIKEIGEVKSALLQCPPEVVIRDLAKVIKKAKGDQLIAVLQILSERRASKYFSTSLKLARSKDLKVKTSALQSLGYLGSPQNIPLLLNEMLKPNNPDAEAYKDAIVTILKDTGTPSDIIVERIKASTQEPNPLLLSILSEVCDASATELVENWLSLPPDQGEGKINLAISAISQWKTPDILPILIEFFRRNPQHPKREEIWKAVIYCLSRGGLENDEKVWVCEQILKILPDKTEEVLKYLGGIPTPDALILVSRYLDDAKTKTIASSSLARIALPGKTSETGLVGKDVIPYLLKAKENLDDALKSQIDEHLRKCEKGGNVLPIVYGDESDFTPIFNGKDLKGWEGYTRGFEVRYGKLVCLPTCHLNLFTNKDYSNFILRFEFKLVPGANNGIGIRVPFMKHSAYDGMEIQILDDSDPSARGLKPWQYHGAIYGVLAPNPKAPLKKCGEWNQEEIIVNGEKIEVIVNGVKIIDANIKELANNPTPDGKEHRGLLNQTGRIALLGHGSKVEFRNIRLKEL